MHFPSISRRESAGKQKFLRPMLAVGLLSLFLIGSAVNAAFRTLELKTLERDALLILTRWQAIDAVTNDVLLKRASITDGAMSRMLSDWEARTLAFSLSLARFNEGRKLAPLGPELVSDVAGAVELWIIAQRSIAASQSSIRSMIRSGLASKVMVNGFLPTFYRMRIEGLLSEAEIIEISDIIAVLEVLDNTSDQFDQRLRAVVARVSRESDVRIRRIVVLSAVLAPALASLAVMTFLSYRRFRKQELRRRKEEARLRHDFLKDLYLSPFSLSGTEEELRALGVFLPFRKSTILGLFRYDRTGPAGEAPSGEALMGFLRNVGGPERELFPLDGDIVAVLVDASDRREAEAFFAETRELVRASGLSISSAVSLPLGAADDRNGAMRRVLALFQYRYSRGPGMEIREGEALGTEDRDYEYPVRTEELLGKRLLEGKIPEARRYVDEILDDARSYGPVVLRATVARLSSALFAVLEKLERASELTLASHSAESLARIVQADTAAEAGALFRRLLEDLEAGLAEKREGRHPELVSKVDAAIAGSYRDPNLSLELIADRLALSAGYLGRVYRRMTGKSVADAVTEVRLEASRSRLAEDRGTIESVASEVGISNPGSFYRLFKARYGVTPAEFREREHAALPKG